MNLRIQTPSDHVVRRSDRRPNPRSLRHPAATVLCYHRRASTATLRRSRKILSTTLRSHRPEARTLWRQPRRCDQIDNNLRDFSDQARDCQNPVDSAKLSADIPTSLLPQDCQFRPESGAEFRAQLSRPGSWRFRFGDDISFAAFRPLSVQLSWLPANNRREKRVPEKKPGGGTDKSLVPPQIPLRNHLTAAILTGIVTHFLTGIDTDQRIRR